MAGRKRKQGGVKAAPKAHKQAVNPDAPKPVAVKREAVATEAKQVAKPVPAKASVEAAKKPAAEVAGKKSEVAVKEDVRVTDAPTLETAPVETLIAPAEALAEGISVTVEAALPLAMAPIEIAEFVQDQIAEGTVDMNKQTIDQAQEAQKVAADRIQAATNDVNERAKAALEKSARVVEELSELTKGNVEALVASSRIAARGVEEMSREAADYGRRSFEEASAVLKSFAEVRSATDLFKLQGDFARSAFDSFVSESSKVSEQVIKLAGEVAEPLTGRYSVAADRVKTLAL
jgi:phasin family protein